MRQVDLLIIGGGSAGMAAAVAAYEQGVRDILLIERSKQLGGVLLQCIHNGFGVHHFKTDLTGVEYAKRYVDRMQELQIPVLTNTFVIDLTKDRVATIVCPETGIEKVQAKTIVLAMGCRERTRGALLIPGHRPAGVITAGTAQRYLNLEGFLPGRKVVILGSGDIGLIMARQFTLEGAKVQEVVEIKPYSSGLPRNIEQCLNDYNIPLHLSTTVVDIHGKSRVEAVTVAKVDEKMQPVPGTERRVECDTLLISAGLIPENELLRQAGVELFPGTNGAYVDECLMTELPGVFACGNALHVHDLVDHVSDEGELAGRCAALYLAGNLPEETPAQAITIRSGFGLSAVTPQRIRRQGAGEQIKISFRSTNIYLNGTVVVKCGGAQIAKRKIAVLNPCEMQNISFDRALLPADADEIEVALEVQA